MNQQPTPTRLTTLFERVRSGSDRAKAELCEIVYPELRTIAGRLVRTPNGTLTPTALVNEFMARTLDRELLGSFENRRCFFSATIEAMKRILVDQHRRRQAMKRGGNWTRVPLDLVLEIVEDETRSDFNDVCLALEELKRQNARACEVVELRFFGGLTTREIADLLSISTATTEREWRLARAKLYDMLRETQGS